MSPPRNRSQQSHCNTAAKKRIWVTTIKPSDITSNRANRIRKSYKNDVDKWKLEKLNIAAQRKHQAHQTYPHEILKSRHQRSAKWQLGETPTTPSREAPVNNKNISTEECLDQLKHIYYDMFKNILAGSNSKLNSNSSHACHKPEQLK